MRRTGRTTGATPSWRDAELARLRAALVEAERERDEARKIVDMWRGIANINEILLASANHDDERSRRTIRALVVAARAIHRTLWSALDCYDVNNEGIEREMRQHVIGLRKVAIEVCERGGFPFTPHLNTANFDVDCKASYEHYMAGDLRMVERSDAMVMVPGWEQSKGAVIELAHAMARGLPVFYYPDLDGLTSTEPPTAIERIAP